jgi:hypothetical protein
VISKRPKKQYPKGVSKISSAVTSTKFASKGVPNFIYPKGIMRGPLNRVVGAPILNGMAHYKLGISLLTFRL